MDLSRSPTRSMVCSSLIRLTSLAKQNPGLWQGFWALRTLSLSEQLAALVRGDAHAQRVELDEAGSVFLIVSTGIIFEGGDTGVEQRVVGLAAGDNDVALVQFQ